jgi:hypothetical protein
VSDQVKSDTKFDQHDEQGEVEAHKRAAHDEQHEETDGDEVEAHRNIRKDTPRLD